MRKRPHLSKHTKPTFRKTVARGKSKAQKAARKTNR